MSFLFVSTVADDQIDLTSDFTIMGGSSRFEGNEGDAIILVALTQFGIAFPDGLMLGQFTAEALVSIVVSALERLSRGEIQVP
jgi:hypothetical protein